MTTHHLTTELRGKRRKSGSIYGKRVWTLSWGEARVSTMMSKRCSGSSDGGGGGGRFCSQADLRSKRRRTECIAPVQDGATRDNPGTIIRYVEWTLNCYHVQRQCAFIKQYTCNQMTYRWSCSACFSRLHKSLIYDMTLTGQSCPLTSIVQQCPSYNSITIMFLPNLFPRDIV